MGNISLCLNIYRNGKKTKEYLKLYLRACLEFYSALSRILCKIENFQDPGFILESCFKYSYKLIKNQCPIPNTGSSFSISLIARHTDFLGHHHWGMTAIF